MKRVSGWPVLLSGAAFCGIALVSCRSAAPEAVQSQTVVPVTAEAAQTGDITAVLHATGTVTPAPGAEFLVVAPEPARILEIPKAEGDRVAAGDLLVRFEIPSTSAEALRQRAEVVRAQAQLENARAAQVRARELFERGVAARKEMEDADRAVAEAQAALAQGEASRGAAETTAARSIVRAPFSGVIAKRLHNPGEAVEPASGAVLRLIDPRRLEVTASIPLTDVSRVVIGAAGRVAAAVPDAPPIPLKVVSRPAAVEELTAAAPVRLMFTAPPTLLPAGTPVRIDIDAERHTGVVVVPLSAIVREGNETALFVVVDNKAVRHPVMLGIADEEHAEVRSGLKVGEMVITQGQAGLPDGASVTLEAPAKP
jgi:RND family efflux transporter MFP subunit